MAGHLFLRQLLVKSGTAGNIGFPCCIRKSRRFQEVGEKKMILQKRKMHLVKAPFAPSKLAD